MSHLIFTLDFHEMVRGKLKKGQPCFIHYDPLRLTGTYQGFVHGSGDFHFTAHLQFQPQGTTSIPLTSEIGVVHEPAIRNDGRGSMLTGEFVLPNDAEEITAWISMKDAAGTVTFDSRYGHNYHFRFTEEDVEIVKASVISNRATGSGRFHLSLLALPSIDQIAVRYRISNGSDPLNEKTVDLIKDKIKKGKQIWCTENLVMPYKSVVIYDLVYQFKGNKFKIENNGNYFIAE
jgi:hypothetical protein